MTFRDAVQSYIFVFVQYYAMFDNNATRGELAKLYNAEQVKLYYAFFYLSNDDFIITS